jgi:hypothetical protein
VRKVHNFKPHTLHSSINNIRVIKSEKIRRPEVVADMEEMSNAYKIVTGRTKIKDHLGYPSRDRQIIFKYILM